MDAIVCHISTVLGVHDTIDISYKPYIFLLGHHDNSHLGPFVSRGCGEFMRVYPWHLGGITFTASRYGATTEFLETGLD